MNTDTAQSDKIIMFNRRTAEAQTQRELEFKLSVFRSALNDTHYQQSDRLRIAEDVLEKLTKTVKADKDLDFFIGEMTNIANDGGYEIEAFGKGIFKITALVPETVGELSTEAESVSVATSTENDVNENRPVEPVTTIESTESVANTGQTTSEIIRKYYEKIASQAVDGWSKLADLKDLLGTDVPYDPARRSFLKKTAVASAGIALAGTTASKVLLETYSGDPESIESELFPQGARIDKIMKSIENLEHLQTIASKIYRFPVGGYAGSLDSRADSETEIDDNAITAMRNNANGSDLRSRVEVFLVENYLNKMSGYNTEANAGMLKISATVKGFDFNPDEYLPTSTPTYGDLVMLFQICTSRESRRLLRDTCYDMQQNGQLTEYGLHPLSPEKIEWANSQSIHPFSLATSESVENLARFILINDSDTWFDAIKDPDKRLEAINYIKEHGISNPGVIAAIETIETAGHINIGDAPALTQLNSLNELYSSSPENLQAIGAELQATWGIPYAEFIKVVGDESNENRMMIESLAGSLRGDPSRNISGSAVYGQLMIPILFRFMCPHYVDGQLRPGMYEQSRTKLATLGIELPPLAPGCPWAMSLLKYLYLNGRWRMIEGDLDSEQGYTVMNYPKGGYQVGNSDKIVTAIKGWFGRMRNEVLESGKDYYNRFRNKPLVGPKIVDSSQ